ncbi:MAG TPA: zf-TFIIB domain-containing protein [Kofleriaceae bacterium]|nr:zf-TFIIB domain-containing protein [Kofleriaceae bacterium]
MSEPMCPVCQEALSRAGFTERCSKCTGAWIHEDALVGMLQERASTMVVLPWQPRVAATGERRACAVCTQPMDAVALGTVALDRCAPHGVWFDPEELASLMKQAKQFKADPKDDNESEGGLLHAFAKLFGG